MRWYQPRHDLHNASLLPGERIRIQRRIRRSSPLKPAPHPASKPVDQAQPPWKTRRGYIFRHVHGADLQPESTEPGIGPTRTAATARVDTEPLYEDIPQEYLQHSLEHA